MCKGFVLPSNCIDDRGFAAFCVFHGTKSVNNRVMCKGFWLLPSHCIDDLGCTAFCVFHGRARRTTRSSGHTHCKAMMIPLYTQKEKNFLDKIKQFPLCNLEV